MLPALPHSSHFVAAGCIAFLVGVALACVQPIPLAATIATSLFGMIIAATHRREIAFFGCVIACIGFGFMRVASIHGTTIAEGEWVDSQAIVVNEQRYPNKQRLVAEIAEKLRVQFDVPLQPRFMFDDRIQLRCILRAPEAFDGFAYDRYLARHHIHALCESADVQFLEVGSSLRRLILVVREHARTAVQHTLPLPEQAIVLGMVFGVDHQLPKEIEDQFRTTSTTHLLVVSGSQIVLIVGVSMRLLQSVLKRRTTMLVVTFFLCTYVVITGGHASVVRASLCAFCLFGVELVGRRGGGLRLLVYVATVMVLVNPYMLLYDVGFQLSFLATAGIICFAARFERRLSYVPSIAGVRTATATSLAATVPTAPLIAFTFHTFSPVSVLANTFAVPLAGILTIGGFAFSMLAAVSEQAAQWFAPLVYTCSHLFLWLVQSFARIPYASITLPL